MEPKSPTPQFEAPTPSVLYERGVESDAYRPTPEQAQHVERGGERIEQRSDATLAQPVATPVPVLPPPLPVEPTNDPAATSHSAPAVAADEDLIEKEWVDRAKQIIESTKNDPYRREQEVNKLQADYLRKRYGRELGRS